jgi:hypothetical protein
MAAKLFHDPKTKARHINICSRYDQLPYKHSHFLLYAAARSFCMFLLKSEASIWHSAVKLRDGLYLFEDGYSKLKPKVQLLL